MAHEIEAKILNINIEELEKKLKDIGAKRVGEKVVQSITFDFPEFPLDTKAAWVRLRKEDGKVWLAYKERLGVEDMHEGLHDSGMEEIEVEVSSFEDMAEILKKIGMIEKFVQEKRRITWTKDDVTYDIDTWPRLDPSILRSRLRRGMLLIKQPASLDTKSKIR